MKPSALVLLALLGLASGRPKQSSQNISVSLLTKVLQGRVAPRGQSPLHPLPEDEDQPDQEISRVKRSLFRGHDNLRWKTWYGSLPNGAVSFYISYTGRHDYVCKVGCDAGFYTPSKGSYCYYPWGDKEYRSSSFDILVNKDNFEFLEWKSGKAGSVPSYSVQTCSYTDIYVGKNKYGLGKIHSRHRAFFLPWKGKEYWYRKYEVLTINSTYRDQKITNVRYSINAAKIFRSPPKGLVLSTVTNNQCRAAKKRVTLSKTTSVEKTWNVARSSTITSGITAKIPFISGLEVSLSVETSVQFDRGTSELTSDTHSQTIDIEVPPNHICTVRMEGRQTTMDIPYTARLTRTYHNGRTTSTSISGTYHGVEVREFRAVIQRCEPVADAKPCPTP